MVKVRTWTPQPEMWDVVDIMAHLSCDETKSKEIMKECKKQHGIVHYGAIENI